MEKLGKRWWMAGLLILSILAGILTFGYQQWYFLIRMGILLPILLGLFLPEPVGRILRTTFGGLGSAGFGFFVYLWSLYPTGRLPGIWGNVALGVEIGLLAVFTILYVATESGVWKSRVLLNLFWIPVLVLVGGWAFYHSAIQPAGIAIEFFSYLPFYAALGLMGKNREKSTH